MMKVIHRLTNMHDEGNRGTGEQNGTTGELVPLVVKTCGRMEQGNYPFTRCNVSGRCDTPSDNVLKKQDKITNGLIHRLRWGTGEQKGTRGELFPGGKNMWGKGTGELPPLY